MVSGVAAFEAGTVVIEGRELHKSFQRGSETVQALRGASIHALGRRDPRHLRSVRLGQVDAARRAVRLGGSPSPER